MRLEDIRQILKQQPFQPLSIRIAEGSTFRVLHPDFIVVSPVGRTIIIFDEDGSFSWVDATLVASVKVQNGKDSESN